MKRLAILGIVVAAFATVPTYAADGDWDPKACMKRCVKVIKEDMEDRIKEGRLEKPRARSRTEKWICKKSNGCA
ncbi:MAG: hypothetical protein CFE43_08310 [Burkholderiales bacterium PBB3]|nr:MAG: hypothetical protein CFE43_08310 [Burkholderiales bacterium PBB3]